MSTIMQACRQTVHLLLLMLPIKLLMISWEDCPIHVTCKTASCPLQCIILFLLCHWNKQVVLDSLKQFIGAISKFIVWLSIYRIVDTLGLKCPNKMCNIWQSVSLYISFFSINQHGKVTKMSELGERSPASKWPKSPSNSTYIYWHNTHFV